MKARVFLDTNILLYADDLDAGAKRVRAQEVLRKSIEAGTAVLSTQVLQEYFVAATRKMGVEVGAARRKVEVLSRLDMVIVQPDLILAAIDLHRLHAISFWDALIIRAAASAACGRLLTEDLGHGSTIDGVLVVNPFLDDR